MQIFVEKIENPNQEFWIWKKEITNRQTGGIYPSAISNVGSGISAAVYQKDEAGHVTQIAQLQLPDYEKLAEYYSAGKEINLNYIGRRPGSGRPDLRRGAERRLYHSEGI